MIIETACSKTNSFLGHIEPVSNTENMINALKSTAPQVDFDIQNFHHETRVNYRNGRVETRRVRVNTHHATLGYRYA